MADSRESSMTTFEEQLLQKLALLEKALKDLIPVINSLIKSLMEEAKLHQTEAAANDPDRSPLADSREKVPEEVDSGNPDRNLYVSTAEERPDSVDDETIRGEGKRGLLEFGEPKAKIPRISSIQKVRMNMPPGEPNIEDDPLNHYLGASESDASFNWIPGQPLSSFFGDSPSDCQRDIVDTDVQSSVDSENAMEFGDRMKELCSQFSPDQKIASHGDEHCTDLEETDDQTEGQHEPRAGPSPRTNQPNSPATVQFLAGFGKSRAPADPKGPKKDQFFFNMF